MRTRVDEILRSAFNAVRDARADKEAITTVLDVMQSVRMQGKPEGMREACKSSHFINVRGDTLVNELTQAQLTDVKLFGDVYYLFIRTEIEPGEDTPEEVEQIKSLKNENAKRLIPLHPTPVHMGFLKYYEHGKGQKPVDGRLFPTFGYGQFYNQRLLVNAKVKSTRTSFHSFRHDFNVIRDATKNEELQDRSMGHAPKRSGARYGKPLTPGRRGGSSKR